VPSRRKYLTGLIAAGVSGIAGCSGYLNRTTGTVSRKTINVGVPTSRGPVWTSLAVLLLRSDRSSAYVEYDPRYITVDTDSVRLKVSKEQYEVLEREFSGVNFVVGIAPKDEGDWVNSGAHRGDFNELQLAGSATVGEYWAEDGTGFIRLHDTKPRRRNLELTDVYQSEIAERS
jgi:hypothetical protein